MQKTKTKKLIAITLLLATALTMSNLSMRQEVFAEDDILFTIRQFNACDPSATCENRADTTGQIEPFPDNNIVHSTHDQGNGCTTSSQCSNTGLHTFAVQGTDNSVIQDTRENNDCRNSSSCENHGTSDAVITGNNNRINQRTIQTNSCSFNTHCNNQAVLEASASGQGATSDEQVNQRNECYGNSNCQNSSTGGSNSQSNRCVSGSSCTNSGTNNVQIQTTNTK